jgi:hypothetical protein
MLAVKEEQEPVRVSLKLIAWVVEVDLSGNGLGRVYQGKLIQTSCVSHPSKKEQLGRLCLH